LLPKRGTVTERTVKCDAIVLLQYVPCSAADKIQLLRHFRFAPDSGIMAGVVVRVDLELPGRSPQKFD